MRRISARPERADGKVGAAQAKGRKADQDAENRRHECACNKSQNERHAIHPEHSRNQRPKAKEGCMTECNLPGIASEQIPALRESNGEEDLDSKVEEIATLGNERKRRKCHRQQNTSHEKFHPRPPNNP